MGTVAIGIGLCTCIGLGVGSVETVLHITIEAISIGLGIGLGQWKHTITGVAPDRGTPCSLGMSEASPPGLSLYLQNTTTV